MHLNNDMLPTCENRSWIVNPFGSVESATCQLHGSGSKMDIRTKPLPIFETMHIFLAVVPGFLFFAIIFIEVEITEYVARST